MWRALNRDGLLCLRGYQTVAAPVFASPFRELSFPTASRAHFPGAEVGTLRSGTQQRPHGAQSLLPGQCGWSWAPFPAPLSRTRSFQQAGMGEVYVSMAGRLRFPQTDVQGHCLCVMSSVGWRGGCASAWGARLPNDPCEAFQPQSSWKRKAEPHWWEHRTSQGLMDTESYLAAPSRAVSLKTNSQISFLGLGDKSREGSLQSALFQGSCLSGSCFDPGENRLTSD